MTNKGLDKMKNENGVIKYEKKYCKDMISTDGPLGNIKCCLESKLGFIPPTGIKCLPSVIIAGAQKTGTTVLSGKNVYMNNIYM